MLATSSLNFMLTGSQGPVISPRHQQGNMQERRTSVLGVVSTAAMNVAAEH